MYEGHLADMKMIKMILDGDEIGHQVFQCSIVSCENDKIIMLLKNAELVDLSLDAVYECNIMSGDEMNTCSGRVEERYVNKSGKVLVFQIMNGFYKGPSINI